MRFLADMGVSPRVVGRLRDLGHEVSHLSEEGLCRLPDEQVFAKARSERRILLTFDLDFGEIAARTESREPSVVLFRLQDTRTANVITRLETALGAAWAPLASGAIVVVEERRIRIRRLPVGG